LVIVLGAGSILKVGSLLKVVFTLKQGLQSGCAAEPSTAKR
jgi:hypothetical protein